MNYKKKSININQLLLNPKNFRFINPEEIETETDTILELFSTLKDSLIELCNDICNNGLNPFEQPIVFPDDDSDLFIAADGNRRICCLKIITQYKEDIENILNTPDTKRFIAPLKELAANFSGSDNLDCVIYPDEISTLDLLDKLHNDSRNGIGRKQWDTTAKNNFNMKMGNVTELISIISFLKHSKYTPKEVLVALSKPRWQSKLERAIISKELKPFLGIDFTPENKLILVYSEDEVVKGLSHLVLDLKKRTASETIRTQLARVNYVNEFPKEYVPDSRKLNKNITTFDPETNKIYVSDQLNTRSAYVQTTTPSHDGSTRTTGKDNPSTDSSSKKGGQSATTLSRKGLMPRDCKICIKQQRANNLFYELKNIELEAFTNVTSIAFRSFFEFSLNTYINSYLNKETPNWSLQVKLQKTVTHLERAYSKNNLQTRIPFVYAVIEAVAQGKKMAPGSANSLHFYVHNHNIYPTAIDLKNLWDNYEQFFRIIWEEINKKIK